MSDVNERHPITISPAGTSHEERIQWLEHHLALAWDQIWWLSLYAFRRAQYDAFVAEGFGEPIDKFYDRQDPWPRAPQSDPAP